MTASSDTNPVTLAIYKDVRVSALLQMPKGATACLVLAHGAGAGMTHPFMAAVADGLAKLKIATLRYQFPFMEQRKRRPDSPSIAHATVRAAVSEAFGLLTDLPLFAGGKSFGGRMTSQAHASSPLPHVQGLVFLGFPLHPAGNPSQSRGDHLNGIQLPMLYLQGTRDALAETSQIRSLCEALGPRASLLWLQDADHSFHVRARSGRTDEDIRREMLNAIATWMGRISMQEKSGISPRH
jgi:predicted alpha/beta-hydrolase family hydrolase